MRFDYVFNSLFLENVEFYIYLIGWKRKLKYICQIDLERKVRDFSSMFFQKPGREKEVIMTETLLSTLSPYFLLFFPYLNKQLTLIKSRERDRYGERGSGLHWIYQTLGLTLDGFGSTLRVLGQCGSFVRHCTAQNLSSCTGLKPGFFKRILEKKLAWPHIL